MDVPVTDRLWMQAAVRITAARGWLLEPLGHLGQQREDRRTWGHRLPAGDVVHHDLSLGNVLARDDAITGVVDWDDAGTGSRVTDLASLLFEWHRLLLDGREAAPGGGQQIASRIAAIAGDNGLRCAIAYCAIDRLALTARRGDAAGTETWLQVTSAVLDTVTRGAAGT